ncbi:MAG: TnsA endonuclease N-terminal domain-containing protein [Bacteroidia bacterium]|jgi:hypothetical protein
MKNVPDAPARKVVSRSPVRTVRIINLPGLFNKPVECESSLERDFVYRAALCPGVVGIRHQPFKLTLASGRRYTPDFLAYHADGSHVVVEIKRAAKVSGYRATFDEAARVFLARSMRFAVFDERAVRERKGHRRAALILRYRKWTAADESKARILDVVADFPNGITLNSLCARSDAAREDVFHLLATRALFCSRLLELSDGALITSPVLKETNHEHRIEGWFGSASWPANT